MLRIPIGHGEGNYFAPPDMLQRLEANRQVVFRYTDPQGRVDEAGTRTDRSTRIAGLCNERRNVVGLMPHPERACEPLLGSVDGRVIFESICVRSAEPALQRCRGCTERGRVGARAFRRATR